MSLLEARSLYGKATCVPPGSPIAQNICEAEVSNSVGPGSTGPPNPSRAGQSVPGHVESAPGSKAYFYGSHAEAIADGCDLLRDFIICDWPHGGSLAIARTAARSARIIDTLSIDVGVRG
jgi:hypothetical protein